VSVLLVLLLESATCWTDFSNLERTMLKDRRIRKQSNENGIWLSL
jgi:hypothetical protein